MKKTEQTTPATETTQCPAGLGAIAPAHRLRMKTGVKAGVVAVYQIGRTDEEQPGNEMFF